MKIIHGINELRAFLKGIKIDKSIGLVPTMGALHQGHLSLVELAKKHSDFTVATIFVNPTQFNKKEDLEKYPSNTDQDLAVLKQAGADLVFVPSVKEIYPSKPELNISFGSLEGQLEGKFRPGHFAGVGLVVCKLFNLVRPDHAFFGQKDLQQFFIIKKLVDELNFNIELHMAPIIREENGLAMSSRNERLSPDQRNEASLIYRSLVKAKKYLNDGNSIASSKALIDELFAEELSLELEYFEVIDTDSFEPLNSIEGAKTIALCLAAEIGNVRLIDNLLLND